MLTFGFANGIDLLSWIVALTLGAKVVATLVLLIVDRQARDRPGWGTILWWVTKLTPPITVPCFAAIAWLQGDAGLLRLSLALGLFVTIAVPLKISQRRRRMARQFAFS